MTRDKLGRETNRFPLEDIASMEHSGASLAVRLQHGCGCFTRVITLTLSDEHSAKQLHGLLLGVAPPDPELLLSAVSQAADINEQDITASLQTGAPDAASPRREPFSVIAHSARRTAALLEVKRLLDAGADVNARDESHEGVQVI